MQEFLPYIELDANIEAFRAFLLAKLLPKRAGAQGGARRSTGK